MLDPECADITARILELLGYEGWDQNCPQVQRAIAYLKGQQETDGSWYGRWGVNYIYGTWQVLRGMRAMNWNMNEPWLKRGAEWLRSVGRDPFNELVIPATGVKLLQWTGRAIRTEEDRAQVICYDKRLTQTSYGKRMLAGLPAYKLGTRMVSN